MMARAFGLHGERVTDPARLAGAFEEAFANAPALLDVVVTQDALSSDAGKGLGWVPTYQALTAWDDAERARRNHEPAGRPRTNAPMRAARMLISPLLTCRHRRRAGTPRTRQDRRARFAPRAHVRAMGRAREPPCQRAARRSASSRATASRSWPTTAWSGWSSTSALARAGLVAVPINFRLVGAEIEYIATHCEARAFIVQDDLIDRVEPIRDALGVAAGALRALRRSRGAGRMAVVRSADRARRGDAARGRGRARRTPGR